MPRHLVDTIVHGVSLLACASLVASCGSSTTRGARPHDMSAAQHEREAQRETQLAGEHAGQFDPNASAPCTGKATVCWSATRNPTDEHRQMAEHHRRAAADHRAASASLRNAEATACAGLDPDDRDISPFERSEDLVTVTSLTEQRANGKQVSQATMGATITMRAVPGLTAEWLQRIVDCHLARNAALGYNTPEMPNCPLAVKHATARVRSTGNGFAVEIRSDQPAAAAEILARAQREVAMK